MVYVWHIALFSVLGIASGILLSFIAKEEIAQGKIYFQWVRRILFLIMCILLGTYSGMQHQYLLLTASVISGTLLLWSEWLSANTLRNQIIIDVLRYVYGIGMFLLAPTAAHQQITATVLFLYGFPAGTLWKEFQKTKPK